MSPSLWAAVAPESEGGAMKVINASRTELLINKQTSCPFAVRRSSDCLLPSVMEITLLLLFVGINVDGGSIGERGRANLCFNKCVFYVIHTYRCVFTVCH